MTALTSFHLFSDLPAELRLKIWEEASSGPSMHIFDVCFPSWRGNQRSERAFRGADGTIAKEHESRYSKYKDSVFLDALEVGTYELDRKTRVARHTYDPSMYRHREIQRVTCADASVATSLPAKDINNVYLPGSNRRVQYDNSKDVLFVRFRDGGAATDLSHEVLLGDSRHGLSASSISEILEGPWTPEMATTLQNARHIALDVVETWTPTTVGAVLFEEVAYLGCCLQQGLEVLYLVDHCPGRCQRCHRHDVSAKQLQSRGPLFQELHHHDEAETKREPDVIQGVGKRYREVFDLEKLGWDDYHPTYVFARMIDEAIRGQQGDLAGAAAFKGVRVLMVEDEHIEGLDTTMLADCDPEDVLDYPGGKVWGIGLEFSS